MKSVGKKISFILLTLTLVISFMTGMCQPVNAAGSQIDFKQVYLKSDEVKVNYKGITFPKKDFDIKTSYRFDIYGAPKTGQSFPSISASNSGSAKFEMVSSGWHVKDPETGEFKDVTGTFKANNTYKISIEFNTDIQVLDGDHMHVYAMLWDVDSANKLSSTAYKVIISHTFVHGTLYDNCVFDLKSGHKEVQSVEFPEAFAETINMLCTNGKVNSVGYRFDLDKDGNYDLERTSEELDQSTFKVLDTCNINGNFTLTPNQYYLNNQVNEYGKDAYSSITFMINNQPNIITMSTSTVMKTGNVSNEVTFTRTATANTGTIVYSSSQPKYVKVDSLGKVTIVKNWTGTAVITASLDSDVSKSYTVKVKPGKMVINKATNVKGKKIKVTWTKMTGANKYQIQVATNSKMTKGKKTYNVTGSASSKTTGKLSKGKTYYVQLKAYDNQTGSWSAWSSKKKVKIKK